MAISPYTYFQKAFHLMQQQKIADAIQHIDSAIVFSSNSPFYIYQKIKFLFNARYTHECSKYIIDQLDFLYKNGSLYLVCRSLDYYQKITLCSEEAFKETLKKQNLPCILAAEYKKLLTTRPSYLLVYAEKILIQDDFYLCIDYCNIILKTYKQSWQALYHKAYAYHMLNDLYKAIEHYKACLAINDTYDVAYDFLGLCLMELGHFEEALSHLKRATLLQPDNLDYLSHMAECYYASKKYKLAQDLFEAIAKEDPTNLQNAFNLTHTLKVQNKKFSSNRHAKKIKKQLKIESYNLAQNKNS